MKIVLALGMLLVLTCPVPTTAATGDVTLPLCTTARHDQYSQVGPDGQTYPSWHPQIDNEKDCHFDHEHGSSPALLGPVEWTYGSNSLVPTYGYVNARAGMSEGHAGFKTYVFAFQGYTWMLTNHFGTSSPPNAACNRFHSVDLVIMEGATKKVDIHFMGDFGPAVNLDTGADLTPTACPTQAADARNAGSNGIRQIPVGATATNYEPWRLDNRELTAIGFRSGGFVINTDDPQKACNADTCDSAVTKMFNADEINRGAHRFFTFNHPDGNIDFRISGAVTGTFYTDPMGMASRTSGQSDSVKQYIASGFSITVGQQTHGHDTGGEGPYWISTIFGNEGQVKLNRLVTGAN